MLLLGFTGEDRDRKADGKLHVILGDTAGNDIGLLTLDHALDALESLRTVEKDLSQ